MSVELEAKKITVAAAQKDCEELLVEIVSERRVADEQKKQVDYKCSHICTPSREIIDPSAKGVRDGESIPKFEEGVLAPITAYKLMMIGCTPRRIAEMGPQSPATKQEVSTCNGSTVTTKVYHAGHREQSRMLLPIVQL